MSNPPNITIVKDNVDEVMKAIRYLADMRVFVGVPQDKGDRKPDPDTGLVQTDAKGEPITNAALAYIHDNGMPEINIPAREFLRPGVKNIMQELTKRFKDAGRLALEGRMEALDKQLHAIGLRAQSAVRAKITDGPFVSLAERTLRERRAKGFKGTKPLIVTGQLRNSINYVIRRKDEPDEEGEEGDADA